MKDPLNKKNFQICRTTYVCVKKNSLSNKISYNFKNVACWKKWKQEILLHFLLRNITFLKHTLLYTTDLSAWWWGGKSNCLNVIPDSTPTVDILNVMMCDVWCLWCWICTSYRMGASAIWHIFFEFKISVIFSEPLGKENKWKIWTKKICHIAWAPMW